MSKIYKVKAAPSIRLQEMTEQEVGKLVAEQADRMLESLPKEMRASDVNTVVMESHGREVADTGVWAQWTRACCDRRRRIEDFTYPEIERLQLEEGFAKRARQNHFDSDFSVRRITEAATLKRLGISSRAIKAPKRKRSTRKKG
ncbi:MAG: hypothetical protein PVI30_16410 [Myxococcales bacterium]|jgi:hypothetical protein